MHKTYEEAYRDAQDKANASGLDVGVWRRRGSLYSGGESYTVRFLPKPENRYGDDLQCEVVRPIKWYSRCAKGGE